MKKIVDALGGTWSEIEPLWRPVKSALDQLGSVPSVLAVREETKSILDGESGTLSVRAAEKSAEFDDVDTAADDVALLAFTSGTTGRPKATMHFHRDVLAIADTFSAHVLRPGASIVSVHPSAIIQESHPYAMTPG